MDRPVDGTPFALAVRRWDEDRINPTHSCRGGAPSGAERPWIFFDPATQMYRLIAAWFGQAGLSPRARMHRNYPEAIKSLVAAGHAAAILPFEPHNRDNAVQSVLQTLGEFA
jgi:DNA-binding transcriptional LysR family regulator